MPDPLPDDQSGSSKVGSNKQASFGVPPSGVVTVAGRPCASSTLFGRTVGRPDGRKRQVIRPSGRPAVRPSILSRRPAHDASSGRGAARGGRAGQAPGRHAGRPGSGARCRLPPRRGKPAEGARPGDRAVPAGARADQRGAGPSTPPGASREGRVLLLRRPGPAHRVAPARAAKHRRRRDGDTCLRPPHDPRPPGHRLAGVHPGGRGAIAVPDRPRDGAATAGSRRPRRCCTSRDRSAPARRTCSTTWGSSSR